ncbi:MAG: aldehyde ferredoxin oxidoreductase family protein, partial [Desulfobacterales bacterium]|nr:aldehyde ferredoxin oxidoreductase family protein [Desulfobacterales bacterium]
MYGFYNRILKIDLSKKSFGIDTVGDEILKKYLGGKGLASYLLYELNPPGVDPLDPANSLIFATGPVTGSAIWGSCRYGVFTKSPQTGFYSESYAGGKVPEAIDSTGFDAIVIQGQSAVPTVLVIHPEGVDFHEAGDIWGMDTFQAEDAVLERFGKSGEGFKRSGAVVIGPAGENLVRFAVIENDYWRSAGRTGVGAVMGSKRIKSVVFQGDRKRSLYDEDTVRAFSKKVSLEGKDNPGAKAYKSMGTTMMVRIVNDAGAFPTRYWSEGKCEHWEKINAEALHERCQVTPRACLKCFLACGRMTTVKQGRHAGLKLEGPEYETIYAFGGLCLIDSIEEIAYLNDICDRLGMDTISAGNLCAFAIEAARRGKIDYKIAYGDVDAIAELLNKIANPPNPPLPKGGEGGIFPVNKVGLGGFSLLAKGGRGDFEDIGDVLARGIKFAAREWDLEDIAVHVKGLEPPGYDPRVLKGMGLGYATSDRGACHLRATFYKPELSGMIDPDVIEGKAELFVDFEDRLTLFDALILCRFYRDLYPWEQLKEIIHSVTGLDVDQKTLQEKAGAISDIVRRFNLREGMKPEDERLPKSLHRKLEKTGDIIAEQELDHML